MTETIVDANTLSALINTSLDSQSLRVYSRGSQQDYCMCFILYLSVFCYVLYCAMERFLCVQNKEIIIIIKYTIQLALATLVKH